MTADFHVHSTYSDGQSTLEEIVQKAIAMKMTSLGISDHSPLPMAWAMKPEKLPSYVQEIQRLKEKYQIHLYCGLEQDLFSPAPAYHFDYIIGSVHLLKVADRYIVVDDNPTILKEAVHQYFHDDFYALTECYYQEVERLTKIKPDIIGHLDLIMKFNENGELFDPDHPRYRKAVRHAIDKLLELHVPFEINTGAISRGYRQTPYPQRQWISYIKEHNGDLILSSDSHHKDTLAFQFPKYQDLATIHL